MRLANTKNKSLKDGFVLLHGRMNNKNILTKPVDNECDIRMQLLAEATSGFYLTQAIYMPIYATKSLRSE